MLIKGEDLHQKLIFSKYLKLWRSGKKTDVLKRITDRGLGVGAPRSLDVMGDFLEIFLIF